MHHACSFCWIPFSRVFTYASWINYNPAVVLKRNVEIAGLYYALHGLIHNSIDIDTEIVNRFPLDYKIKQLKIS